MKKTWIILQIAGLALIFSCNKHGNTDNADVTDTKPLVTEKGVATGATSSFRITPEGGSITSEDGNITLTIPPGAVASTLTVGITPIVNHVPLGLGNGYRLIPEGTQFAKPVTLRFHYKNIPLEKAIPDFLWITTQQEDGTWLANTESEVDTVAQTVSVSTTHFSDWALGRFIDLSLAPASATLAINENVTLAIKGFLKPAGPDNEVLHPLAPIGSELAAIDPVMALLDKTKKYKEFKITGWGLNGAKAPVSNNFGSLQYDDKTAVFTAPAARPNPNVVAVSASIDAWQTNGRKTGYQLVSNIAIIDTDYYLSITVDNQDYYYAQYIAPNIPPDPYNLNAATAGIAALSNSLEIRGSHVKLSSGTAENIFHINFTNPIPGRRSFKCKYNNTGEEDEIEFTPNATGAPYLMNYVTRYTNDNGTCIPDYKCADITFTLLEFTGAGKVARGSFSGYVYADPDAFATACKSSEKHFITGEFKLLLTDN